MHRMEHQGRMSPQPLERRLTCRGIARPLGEGAPDFDKEKRRGMEAQALPRHRAQERDASLMKVIVWIEGGDPATGI
ncbi:MAG: hypothetical protein QN129_10035 [Armatimonadota bacterium]|nr:hypothetical protein [Armatimonadota bacterium]MDR7505224.1 hypothetical protein [Armatimonadota bacterium]MDR7573956.1 hypothetical protein [Armatimonadota bacterium]